MLIHAFKDERFGFGSITEHPLSLAVKTMLMKDIAILLSLDDYNCAALCFSTGWRFWVSVCFGLQ